MRAPVLSVFMGGRFVVGSKSSLFTPRAQQVSDMTAIRVGSEAHKELFCGSFVDTHRPFRPVEIVWPDLQPEAAARLRAVPLRTAAARPDPRPAGEVQTLPRAAPGPVVSETISRQDNQAARLASTSPQ